MNHSSIEKLQTDLDVWLVLYKTIGTRWGKCIAAEPPMETLEEGKKFWQDKYWIKPDLTDIKKNW